MATAGDLRSLLLRPASRGLKGLRCLIPLYAQVLDALELLHSGRWKVGGEPLVHQAPSARRILVMRDGTTRLTDLTHVMGAGMPRLDSCEERLRADEMAPEQALAPTHVDPRCDLFIVGIGLWQALTGRSLFAG